MRALITQSKNLLNMKIVVNYFNFVFHIELKTKPEYKVLNFVFSIYQKHETAVWVHELARSRPLILTLRPK